MIWYIWLIFFLFSLFLLYLGLNKFDLWLILPASLLILVCGVILLWSGLEYKSGSIESYNYVCLDACANNTNTSASCEGNFFFTSCDLMNNNQTACTLQGCTYNLTSNVCSGTPLMFCDDITTFNQESCEFFNPICVWTNATTSSLNTTNSTYLSSTIKTDTYSTYKFNVGTRNEGRISGSLTYLLIILAIYFVIYFISMKNKEKKQKKREATYSEEDEE